MAKTETQTFRRDNYKRSFDLTLLAVSHVALFPLWILLWITIPLLIWVFDRGPIFYKQQRAGKDGRVFTALKFRTMVPNADRLGPSWTVEGDVRITKIGKLLRRTALDELPQLISIWKGDMSLVGPRALSLKEQKDLEDQISGFADRLQIRPGLTGMAQVYDRADNANDKYAHDQEYLNCMGPLLDTKLIILFVINSVFSRWDHRSGKSRA